MLLWKSENRSNYTYKMHQPKYGQQLAFGYLCETPCFHIGKINVVDISGIPMNLLQFYFNIN